MPVLHPSFRLLLFCAVLLLLPVTLRAQRDVAFTLTADSLQQGKAVELSKLAWKYHPGDLASNDPAWADPALDDRAWETLNGTAITLDSIPQSGWRGSGWFRLRLKVDPALGLPERFNPQNEMFDESQTKLALAAAQSSLGIIDHFVKAGDEWAAGRPQDDVTFVVLKVKA